MSDVKRIVTACLLLFAACAPTGGAPDASPTVPPDWSIHGAAGLRIAAPSTWVGPEVLPARDATGPRAWIVFRDLSGAEAVTLMTWRDETASALAAAQYESERPRGDAPQELTLADGTRTRTVVAMSGYAHWSDATGAGSYECRALYVQVDPRLVAAVIACGPALKGNTTPTPEVRRTQEQVVLRLGVAGGAP
jgi:hypothetical protein